MSRHVDQALQGRPLPTHPTRRYFKTAAERCYLTHEVCEKLRLSRRTFFALKAKGELPLVELRPRLGRLIRYQAEPIDRFLAGGR